MQKSNLANKRFRELLEEIALPSPTPGGGSVSALTGALAASLVAMVCGLTIGKKKYQAVQGKMKKLRRRMLKVMEGLLELAEEDTRAFDLVMANLRGGNKNGLQGALKGATLTPLETARLSFEVLKAARECAREGNKNARTDAEVAIELSRASIRGATFNVKVNLNQIKDETFRSRVLREVSGLIL